MKQLDKLNALYEKFFEELEIDRETGIKKGTGKRFATKIAIGDNYYECKKKILFVSFDMGKDEMYKENTYQDFDQRKRGVCNEDLSDKNPHMAGVYGTALYFLKDDYNWQNEWDILEKSNRFFQQAIYSNIDKLPVSVLTYISLINFYNFVTIGREGRAGGNDRAFFDEKKELELLINIINIIKPDIIVVQSKSLRNYFVSCINPKIQQPVDIYIGCHPSIFGRGVKYRKPNLYIENLLKGKI